MKLFTALFLSSKKRAYVCIPGRVHSGIFGTMIDYVVQVRKNEYDDYYKQENGLNDFTLQVFRVTYPDRAPGKGWGDPKVANIAHFSQDFGRADLYMYLQKLEIDPEDNWVPVEDDNELFSAPAPGIPMETEDGRIIR